MKKYINKLINPDRLYRMEDVITSLCPIPETAGVYVWYFRDIPKPLPKLDFNTFDGCSLLYVGICPRSNKSSTNRNIRRRILEHYGKTTAEGSTLRFTLGVLLGLPLFLKGASKHGSKTFSKKGEQDLSDWMSENAYITWQSYDEPWVIEKEFLNVFGNILPLNIQDNPRNPFIKELGRLRSEALKVAKSKPRLIE